MAKIERKANGYWYVVVDSPRCGNTIEMGGYATESDAKEMRDYIAGELDLDVE